MTDKKYLLAIDSIESDSIDLAYFIEINMPIVADLYEYMKAGCPGNYRKSHWVKVIGYLLSHEALCYLQAWEKKSNILSIGQSVYARLNSLAPAICSFIFALIFWAARVVSVVEVDGPSSSSSLPP